MTKSLNVFHWRFDDNFLYLEILRQFIANFTVAVVDNHVLFNLRKAISTWERQKLKCTGVSISQNKYDKRQLPACEKKVTEKPQEKTIPRDKQKNVVCRDKEQLSKKRISQWKATSVFFFAIGLLIRIYRQLKTIVLALKLKFWNYRRSLFQNSEWLISPGFVKKNIVQ